MRVLILIALIGCGGPAVVSTESDSTAAAASARWRVIEYWYGADGVADRSRTSCYGTLILDASGHGTLTCSSRCLDDGTDCVVPAQGATALSASAVLVGGELRYTKIGNQQSVRVGGFDPSSNTQFEAQIEDPYAPPHMASYPVAFRRY